MVTHLPRHSPEHPRLGQRTLVEVVADRECVSLSGLVVQPSSDGCRRGRVNHRELHEAPWLEHPTDLLQRSLRLADVHQAHERRDEIEDRAAKGQVCAVAENEPDAARARRDGGLEERIRDIQCDDIGFGFGEQSGVVALAAAEVEPDEPGNTREQGEERWRVDEIAINIEASTRQLDPPGGVRVPEPPSIGSHHGEILTHHGPATHAVRCIPQRRFGDVVSLTGRIKCLLLRAHGIGIVRRPDIRR